VPERDRINVEITYRSGYKEAFEITDEVLQDVEASREAGLSAEELCRSLAARSPWDAPKELRIFGKRSDGRDVSIELSCRQLLKGRSAGTA
jgi:hypothetical protein